MIDSIERVIVIVGCQRSGTTLTGQILGAHPEAVLMDEPDGLYDWFHAFADGMPNADVLFQRMLIRAQKKYREPDSRFTGGGNGLAHGVRVLIFKAPNLSYDARELAAFQLPLSLVYPIRDPRAVVASMARLSHIDFAGNQARLIQDRPEWAAKLDVELKTLLDTGEKPWIRHATIWKAKSGLKPWFVDHGLSVHQFRYEDLIESPRTTLKALSDFAALGSFDLAQEWDATYIGNGPGGTDRTRPLDGASQLTWRSVLDEQMQADALRTCGSLARSFGYG